MTRIDVINGPNLNLLGSRQPEVYGTTTLAELEARCVEWGRSVGVEITTFQSNHEGALIDRIHDGGVDGLVLNAGAFTHYSYALHDAIVAVATPTVEVHISDIHQREPWRRVSVVQPACLTQISGEGIDGYRRAIEILGETLR
ncbi:MAG: type II 3-dehydroquinate dehydratase [Acidimicrobiia bacterium]|nr:type II 3-dehydroquinate dehydratase [Acidimicrobiia bacterium]NNF11377.1 type II 3-dehydroquinate dehydratase [Acidimicrobiia bacterium]NNL68702.1 type II 3-dehydroquinate dehydratase [Acidimicrobiia bacterium]